MATPKKKTYAPGGPMDPGGQVLKPKPVTAPVFNPNFPGGVAPVAPAAAPAAAAAAASSTVPPVTGVDWEAALGLDPGLTAANSAADAAIANLNEQYNGANNQYSTVHQLDRSLRTGLRSNADTHASHGTLFSGGTAQQAANVDHANQQARYDATNTLNANIGAQTAAKAAARGVAVGNVLAHPSWYGVSDPDATPAPTPAAAPAAAATPAASPVAPMVAPPNPYVDGKTVAQVQATLKKNPAAAWRT